MQFKLNVLALLILVLLGQVSAIARPPAPNCFSKPIFKEFPLTHEEVFTHDLSNIFSGYNLDITLAKESNIASVSRKWNVLDRANMTFQTIISHYVENRHKTVGRDSFLLYSNNAGVHLSYGIIR